MIQQPARCSVLTRQEGAASLSRDVLGRTSPAAVCASGDFSGLCKQYFPGWEVYKGRMPDTF